MTLLVMTPTRWRRENCERYLKSFTEATDFADLLFITDADDQETYRDMDWGVAKHAVMDTGKERVGTTRKVNHAVDMFAGQYDAFMYLGDDHLYSTPHWDTIMMGKLASMPGGTGMLYGDDRRRADIPEMIIISADIVETLGYFAEPTLAHYYIDNVWAELGKRSGLLRYVPQVLFEHLHYQVRSEVEHDRAYRSAENLWGQRDASAYQEWAATRATQEVSMLRRKFNPDLKWVTSLI